MQMKSAAELFQKNVSLIAYIIHAVEYFFAITC